MCEALDTEPHNEGGVAELAPNVSAYETPQLR